MIESQNTLAILKKIDSGDISGARVLASEIVRASKTEMIEILNKETVDVERRSAHKIINEINKYLGEK